MTESQLFNGDVLVVTGGGRGIGREIALLAASQGARVVVNDLGGALDGSGSDDGPAAEVVARIRETGGEAVASTDSVADWTSAQRIITLALDTWGRLDALVNNAGILRDTIFHQMPPEDFDSVVRVHLYGSFYMSRAAAPVFRRAERGAFVHMTSTSGLVGGLGQANYAAAKLGIVGLSKSIALDMARYNVRSNCVSPSAFSRMIESVPPSKTPPASPNLDPAQPQTASPQQPPKRPGTSPAQIAPLAVFLASDAASEVNGQIIGARGNELYLYSQPRPVRTLHRATGWTPASLSQMVEAWRQAFVPLERGRDVFAWDPI